VYIIDFWYLKETSHFVFKTIRWPATHQVVILKFNEAQKTMGTPTLIDFDMSSVSVSKDYTLRITGNTILELTSDLSQRWEIKTGDDYYKNWFGEELNDNTSSFRSINEFGAIKEIHYNENSCQKCHPSCLTCDGVTENNCLSCNIGYQYIPADRYCKKICPNDSYWGETSGQEIFAHGKTYILKQECLRCHDSCKTCTGG
jgi:hypothetical protein